MTFSYCIFCESYTYHDELGCKRCRRSLVSTDEIKKRLHEDEASICVRVSGSGFSVGNHGFGTIEEALNYAYFHDKYKLKERLVTK
jgi:hypothetical protein